MSVDANRKLTNAMKVCQNRKMCMSDVVEPNGRIKKVLRLLASYTKGAKHRDISLENKSVIKSLQDYIAVRTVDDGLTFNYSAPLFKSQKKIAFSVNAMVRVLGDIYKSAGIDLNSIRQIAGHSSISTTQRYIEDNPYKIADILRAL